MIGLSYTDTNFQFYKDWFPGSIVLSYHQNNVEDFEKCDGFVLTGGVDVHPSFYGGSLDYANNQQWKPERDMFEMKILEYAFENKLPVLAICRGMQLVNVFHGGTLVQDLGSANEIHKKDTQDKQHNIVVEENSLLHSIVKETSGNINSAHHQAIDKLGKDLTINAQSDDGIAEGLESTNKNEPFLLCVQWHPERMQSKETSPFSQSIKEKFLEAVENTKQKA